VSANSENIIFKHSLNKHAGEIPRALPNPQAGNLIFDEKFWREEYGIYKTKEGSVMQAEFPPDANQTHDESLLDCQHCDFKTTHPAALKRHSTTHKFTYGYVLQ